MIKIVNENVFDSNADCITNTVNCIGFMGKGLALEFALRFPELEREYIQQCKNHIIKTGRVYFYNISGQKILNFPTKFHYKNPSQLEWIEQGLDFIVQNYKKWNVKSIALPILGAKNGGLNSNVVISLMQKKLHDLDIPIYICLNKIQDKISITLLERFNSCDPYVVSEHLSLNVKQTAALVSAHKKINRFIDISDLPGIGSMTYRKIYNYFFNNEARTDQMSLLEI